MGYVPSGFYGGLTLGRFLLSEPTHRFGELKMLLSYTVIIFAMQLVFWLVPNIISSAVSFSIMGFFLGPFFVAVGLHTNFCMNIANYVRSGDIGCFKASAETHSTCGTR
jgi:fucose permease